MKQFIRDLQQYSLNAFVIGTLTFFTFLSSDAHAQGCTGGVPINSAQTSTVVISTNNECLSITESGSITVIGPSDNAIYVNLGVTGAGINNAGSLTGNFYGISNDGSITSLINSATAPAMASITGGSLCGIYGCAGVANFGTIGTLINSANSSIAAGLGVGIVSFGSTSSIGILDNSGTISGPGFSGIQNEGTIGSLENRSGGLIDGDGGILNYGTAAIITTITNAGGIVGNTSQGITNEGTILNLTNQNGGAISGFSTGIHNSGVASLISRITNSGLITGNLYGVDNDGMIGAITNNASGSITAGGGILNRSTGSIAVIDNLGLISATVTAIGNVTGGRIASLTNSGTISSDSSHAIANAGSISAIANTSSGIINGGAYGIANDGSGAIESITNAGSIIGLVGGIYNFGSIGTLNNLQGQGNANGALIYDGQLPGNYNVIINSPTQYGQLTGSVVGATTFGIYTGSTVTRGTYSAVLSGFSSSNLNNTSGTFNGFRWSLSNSSADIWDLIVTGASTADTQQSLVNTASVLQGTYTLQNSVMVNGFTYDCSLFDRRGICISAGGRNTTVQAQGINNTSGLLIASYRLNQNNSRIGAWVDQNLSVSGPGTVKLGNSTPMIGLFGVWSQRSDGVGTEVKVSAAYGQKDTTITRQIVGTSEAGTGSSQLISQGAQVLAKYGFAVMPDVVVSPYAGVRYTQNNMGGYTEATSSAVTTPLTYSALNTNATTALAGVGARYQGIPKTTLFASAGVETDTNTSNGSYSATGVDGLTPVNFNPNPVKTRPTATVGGYYDILKNQRIGVTGIYRQEPFQAVSTTTVLATYTIGF
ncbi:beta strand repeat-containing protein [Polynucleobacter sp. HIN7]|uniref:beta strand repeat-containing protein n=1 Tax=Polynucleobacter sp. HIN7 TaxID=3047866 RepID=UPI0025726AF4|nr:hypothetical protein [Polynucleobacter sp. HIN7]BEI36619.1 hypothetical protein PHIN7_03430 [Polynucleobacter sp. HIN7]